MLVGTVAEASVTLWNTYLWTHSFNTTETPGQTFTLRMVVVTTMDGDTFMHTPYLVLDMCLSVEDEVRRRFTERLLQYGVEVSSVDATETRVRVLGNPWSLRYKTVLGSSVLGCTIFKSHSNGFMTRDWVVQRSLNAARLLPHLMMISRGFGDPTSPVMEDSVEDLTPLLWHYSNVLQPTMIGACEIRSLMEYDLGLRDELITRFAMIKEVRCAWEEYP